MAFEMEKVAIVIPTLVCAERLEACLRSIQLHGGPCDVRILNNWTHSGVARVCRSFEGRSKSGLMNVIVESHPYNLGCAGSWNRGIKAFFDDGFEWALVINDDVELLPDTVSSFIEAIGPDSPLVWSPNESMSAFAIHKRAIEKVGWFDENFWPAYREDEDFVHRMKVAGIRPSAAPGAEVLHCRSSSLNYSEYLWFQHRTRFDQQNLLYYGRKWGGAPHHERFTSPFNQVSNKLNYWPSPDEKRWGLKLDENDRVLLDSERDLKVRLYGAFSSTGSFSRVSKGIREGLEDLGLLDGCVDLDTGDSDEMNAAPGKSALVGIYAGNPSLVSVMASQGQHEMNFVVMAPNSTWMPERLVQSVKERAAIVAPSTWGASVLQSHGLQEFPPLRHGVSKSFAPDPRAAHDLSQMFEEGQFRVLHLSSTNFERKGTRQLIEGWKRAVARGEIGKKPRLLAIVDAPEGTYPEAASDPTIAMTNRRINGTESQMPMFYQNFHVVCQPSRGEGFGMVPLEARACGIPVVATDCTGHSDHLGNCGMEAGCVIIKTGSLESIDDGPGALAPALRSEDVEEALVFAYSNWRALFDASREKAPEIRAQWSWSNQTQIWLRNMGFYGDKND